MVVFGAGETNIMAAYPEAPGSPSSPSRASGDRCGRAVRCALAVTVL